MTYERIEFNNFDGIVYNYNDRVLIKPTTGRFNVYRNENEIIFTNTFSSDAEILAANLSGYSLDALPAEVTFYESSVYFSCQFQDSTKINVSSSFVSVSSNILLELEIKLKLNSRFGICNSTVKNIKIFKTYECFFDTYNTLVNNIIYSSNNE